MKSTKGASAISFVFGLFEVLFWVLHKFSKCIELIPKKKVLQTTEFRYKILLREISCQFCNTSFLFENPTLLMHFFWFSRRVDIWPRLYLWLVPHHTQFCDFLPRRWHIHQHCIFHSIKLLNDLKSFFFFFSKLSVGTSTGPCFIFHSIPSLLLC